MASDKHETASSGQHPPGATPTSAHQAARTPQQDHTPRQEEQYARDKPPVAPQGQAAAPDPKAAADLRAAQAASSIGAQIILDYNSDSGLGARGGAGADIVENQIARDQHLVALGLDPVGCSGPPPSPAVLKARREAEKAEAEAAATMPTQDPKATRMSSLAAGIAPDMPPPAEGGAPSNVDVPFRGAGRNTA
jgi:hypothetical protein